MSSDDEIGNQAEQEYEATLIDDEPAPKPKKTRAKPLSMNERARVIADYRNGKFDKFYDCRPDPNKPGEFKVIKRRKPLNNPQVSATAGDVSQLPVPEVKQEVKETVKEEVKETKKEEKVKFPTEFFSMQSSINNNLTKELQALHDKYKKLSQKFKEERAKKNRREETEYEYVSEYEEDEKEAPPPQPEPVQQPVVQYNIPYIRRKRLDIRNF